MPGIRRWQQNSEEKFGFCMSIMEVFQLQTRTDKACKILVRKTRDGHWSWNEDLYEKPLNFVNWKPATIKPEIALIINVINVTFKNRKTPSCRTELLKLNGVTSMDVLQSSANWTGVWWLVKFLNIYIYIYINWMVERISTFAVRKTLTLSKKNKIYLE